VILPPIIDGRLDEGIWQQPSGYSGFLVQGQPDRPARRQTVFRVAYDAANVYLALSCPTDTSIGPPKIRHWQEDDEAIDEDESCRVLLWPEPNQENVHYEFTINPQGVVCDARRHGGFPISSAAWNGPTRAAATVGRGIWEAELMVPLQQLGIPDKPWRINVIRHDALAEERSTLVPTFMPTSAAPVGTSCPNALLTWPVPAKPFLTMPLPVRFVRLADMEDSADAWQASGALHVLSESHVFSGRRSLEVRFQPGGGRIGRGFQQTNFSGWHTLKFDLFLEGDGSAPLAAVLHDAAGRTRTIWFFLRPGTNDVALPLGYFGAGLQLRSIKTLELVSRDAAHIWLDNIRLEEDLLSYHELSNRPARQSKSNLVVLVHADLSALPMTTPSLALDVTVPLFGTQKVRRLERRNPTRTHRFVFQSDDFVGHDVRDPVKVAAFFRMDGQDYVAFRLVRLSQANEQIEFTMADFPLNAATERESPGSDHESE